MTGIRNWRRRFLGRSLDAARVYRLATRLFLVVVVAIVLLRGAFYFQAETGNQRGHLLNVVDTLSHNAEYVLGHVETSLKATRQSLAADIASGKNAYEINLSLTRQRDVIAIIDEIDIYSRNGEMLYASGGSNSLFHNVRQRSDFKYLKLNSDRDLFIDGPVHFAVEDGVNIRAIHASLPLHTPDGRFNGIISATVRLPRIAEIFTSVKIANDGYLAILNRYGRPLVQVSFRDGRMLKGALLESDETTLMCTQYRDDAAQAFNDIENLELGGYKPIATGDLCFVVRVPYATAYGPFLWYSFFDILISIAISTVILLLAHYSFRSYRRDKALIAYRSYRLRRLAEFSTDILKCKTVDDALQALCTKSAEVLDCERVKIEVRRADGQFMQQIVQKKRNDRSHYNQWPDLAIQGSRGRFYHWLGRLFFHEDAPNPQENSARRGDFGMRLNGTGEVAYIDFSVAGQPEEDTIGWAISEQCSHLAMAAIENLLLQVKTLESAELARKSQMQAEVARTDAVQKARFSEEILNSISDNFFALDEHWRFTHVNQQAMEVLGFPAGELLGRSIWDLMPHLREGFIYSEFHLARETGEKREFEYYSDERGRWYADRVYPFERGISVYFTDITRRVKMQDELRQTRKLKAIGTLTAGIAHDFNNLLTVVQNNIELMAMKMAEDDDLAENLELCEMATDRAASLTRQLLAFSRKQPLSPKEVDIASLLATVRQLLQRTLGSEIAIVIEASDDLAHAFVDPVQLENALINLSVNARDAMPEGGTIYLRAEMAMVEDATSSDQLRSFVRISVRDTGTGMPEEVRKDVFEPFFTTKEVGKGSGLGLSMVHGFAYQSGGRVEIASTVGVGTEVILYLPQFTGAKLFQNELPTDIKSLEGKEHLVVVKENPQFRRYLADWLRGLGYRVDEFGSQRDFLKTASSGFVCDGVIAELLLGEESEVAEHVEQLFRLHAGLKVVYLVNAGVSRPGKAANAASVDLPAQPSEVARALRGLFDGA
ncbi:sensor histidine kinase [Thalassospira marina]|uniref:sensor histidine kinase n=1 Tax=Thalassospira marina TaxID=2048283 RepID=UPI0010563874|nr:ATP-binding protein [Thalassospira marina]